MWYKGAVQGTVHGMVQSRVQSSNAGWNGDVYKAVRELRSWQHVDLYTADVLGGVSVVLRRPNSDALVGLPQPIDWPQFVSGREAILRLKQPADVLRWIGASSNSKSSP